MQTKTLTSRKPRERTAIAATRELMHQRYIAQIDGSPMDANDINTKILQIKQDTVQEFLDAERERQYNEMMLLSDANKLVLERTQKEIEAQRQALAQKHQKELEELDEVQEVNRTRLSYFNEEKRPKKTQSKEYLGLQKEFKKLMSLKEFERAEQVKKLMDGCEFEQMNILMERYEAYCQLEITKLQMQQAKERDNMLQRQQTEKKNFEKQSQLLLFRTIQNIKNAKTDMTHAHKLEFINFAHNNIDRDIVNDKRHCVEQSTSRGTQKFTQALNMSPAQLINK